MITRTITKDGVPTVLYLRKRVLAFMMLSQERLMIGNETEVFVVDVTSLKRVASLEIPQKDVREWGSEGVVKSRMTILRDVDSTLFLVYCWVNDRREVVCGYQKVGVREKDMEVSCMKRHYFL